MNEKDVFVEGLKKRTKKFGVEEIDESVFWLEVIDEAGLSNNQKELNRLVKEGTDILKIVTKSKDTTYKNLNK